MLGGVQAGEHANVGGVGCRLRAQGVLVKNRLPREGVDVRRGVPGVSVTTQVVGAKRIERYEYDVRADGLGRSGSSNLGQYEKHGRGGNVNEGGRDQDRFLRDFAPKRPLPDGRGKRAQSARGE